MLLLLSVEGVLLGGARLGRLYVTGIKDDMGCSYSYMSGKGFFVFRWGGDQTVENEWWEGCADSKRSKRGWCLGVRVLYRRQPVREDRALLEISRHGKTPELFTCLRYFVLFTEWRAERGREREREEIDGKFSFSFFFATKQWITKLQ